MVLARWKRAEASTHFGPKLWPALGKNNAVLQASLGQLSSSGLNLEATGKEEGGRRKEGSFASLCFTTSCIETVPRNSRRWAEGGPKLLWPQSVFCEWEKGISCWPLAGCPWLGAPVLSAGTAWATLMGGLVWSRAFLNPMAKCHQIWAPTLTPPLVLTVTVTLFWDAFGGAGPGTARGSQGPTRADLYFPSLPATLSICVEV